MLWPPCNPPTSPTWYIPPRLLCSTVLHLYKVRTAFQAFKQHPHSLYECTRRRLPLIDFPRDTSCPPLPGALFLFPILTPRDHDQRPPRRIVRIPAAAFAWPAGCRVCVRVCRRKVRGKGRPVYLSGHKGGVVITGALQPVSCCVYIAQHLRQILRTEVFSAFQHRRIIKDRPACARVLRKGCRCKYGTQPLQISNMYCWNVALQTLTCCLYVPMNKTQGSSKYNKLSGALKVCECGRIWGSTREDNYIKCTFGNNCASVLEYLRCPQWTPPHMFSTGCKLAERKRWTVLDVVGRWIKLWP